MSRKSKAIFWIIRLILIVCCYFALIALYYHRMAPPKKADIQSFSQHIKLTRFKEGVRDSASFYLGYGENPPLYVLASGPPVYVFDEKGILIDWIQDSGENGMNGWNLTTIKNVSYDKILIKIKNQE